MRNNIGILCAMAVLAFAGMADAQGPGGRGGRGGPGGRGGLISLASNEAVQKDLALSSDAAAKVKELADEFRESLGNMGNFRDMSQDERAKAFEKMQEAGKAATEKLLPKLKTILTPEQFTRLQQIHWQTLGTAAFTDAEVVKALTITSAQQDQIKSVNSDFDAKQRELFQSAAGGGGRGEMREKFDAIAKDRQAKVDAVLTKDQLAMFATLTGAKFDVSQLGGRGPGGPGGGGPGGGQGARGKRPQPKAE
ncbi:hypothetical protein [Schlesneria paludicola]|uniref:hypothetical protein n=1 Tax=Schlesneria paludicola TaxID=360056 RepID=UPI00029A5765|nr:hypothetical protein [Schlesneria paludicola]